MATDHLPATSRLGSYEIVRRLARGGMAELFLARTIGPEGFEKLVVLKKILPALAKSPKFTRLFVDEAKLAAALDHPYIAHVYELAKSDGSYFFTMEYVHGQDLRQVAKRAARQGRRIAIDQAVQIAHAVASALHYAHERRSSDGELLEVVHRDVSPSNILIAYDGAIKLVDFGVAKAATSTVKTRTGTLKGKVSYMSPEQARGGPIDRRSDVFSLGIVLWELVAGQRLFKGDNDLATIQMIINSPAPRPSAVRPECPPELERIVVKALAIDPGERYQTAEELQLELEELARETKLKISTVALRGTMHELFAEELAAWRMAQASGVTLTEHVAAAILAEIESGTPASDGGASDDLDDAHEIEPDDVDDRVDRADVFVEDLNVSMLRTAQDVPALQAGAFDAQRAPSVQMAVQAQAQPSVLVARTTTPTGGMPPLQYPSAEPSAFPIAPREWRAAGPSKRQETERDRAIKRYAIGGLVVLALIAVAALAFGGGGASSASPDEGASEPAPPVIEMKAQPANR